MNKKYYYLARHHYEDGSGFYFTLFESELDLSDYEEYYRIPKKVFDVMRETYCLNGGCTYYGM